MTRLRLWWEQVRYPDRWYVVDPNGVMTLKPLPWWRRVLAKQETW